MITLTEAKELANSFVKSQGEVVPNIYYGINEPQEFIKCYYFDFLLVDKNGKLPSDLPLVAGAPGFTVNKETGNIDIISFGELSELISQRR